MSDEVNAAADRLRRWRAMDRYDMTTPHEYRDGECFKEERMRADLFRLACQWEAEHANDDEHSTPLTAEILEASGWVRPCGWATRMVHESGMQFYCSTNGLSIEVEVFGKWCSLETVGDLRNLLDALHIPAVVVVPKREESDGGSRFRG